MTWDEWPLEFEPTPHTHLWQPPHQHRGPDNQSVDDAPEKATESSAEPAPGASGELWTPGDELDLTSMDFTADFGAGSADGSME